MIVHISYYILYDIFHSKNYKKSCFNQIFLFTEKFRLWNLCVWWICKQFNFIFHFCWVTMDVPIVHQEILYILCINFKIRKGLLVTDLSYLYMYLEKYLTILNNRPTSVRRNILKPFSFGPQTRTAQLEILKIKNAVYE